ncbi:MAG: hypothetical protein ICV63_17500 [Coleofasciculus sp. Co-bin14]|nr:hypothetical protein [Coleofasciculus sp. Co-bin14]
MGDKPGNLISYVFTYTIQNLELVKLTLLSTISFTLLLALKLPFLVYRDYRLTALYTPSSAPIRLRKADFQ